MSGGTSGIWRRVLRFRQNSQSLDIGQLLAQAEPDRTDYQLDVAISLRIVGRLTGAQDMLEDAHAITI